MRKGFTLIELLVVVLIMGILASVAMPQYFKTVEKSRSAEAIEVLSAIVDVQERVHMKTGSYVQSISNLYKLDVGLSNLSYFTIISFASIRTTCYAARLNRNTAAGAGLGSYYIELRYPTVPGTGQRTWVCSPVSAGCKSFLPE